MRVLYIRWHADGYPKLGRRLAVVDVNNKEQRVIIFREYGVKPNERTKVEVQKEEREADAEKKERERQTL